jgi:hypothetical protein
LFYFYKQSPLGEISIAVLKKIRLPFIPIPVKRRVPVAAVRRGRGQNAASLPRAAAIDKERII